MPEEGATATGLSMSVAKRDRFAEKGELNLAYQIQENTHQGTASASLGLLAKNAVANLVQPGTAWIIVLFLPPILIRTLDRSTFATWMLLLQFGTYVLTVNDTIRICGRHFVGRSKGLGDRAYLSRILSSGTVILAAVSLVAAIFSLLAFAEFPHIFRDIPTALIPQATTALLIICLASAGGLPFSIFSGAFEGDLRSVVPAVMTAAFRFAGAIGIAWAAYRKQGLVAMALWFGASNFLLRVSFVPAWRRWGTGRFFRLSSVAFAQMREFLKFMGTVLANQFCGVLIGGLDLPIVAMFDFQNAAYYAVATTLSSIVAVPYAAAIGTIQPVVSSISARGTPERLGDTLVRVTRWSNAILVLITLPLLTSMSFLLRLWVGDKYSIHALPIGLALVTAVLLRELLRPYNLATLSAGCQQRTLISPAIESIVNVACSLLLVQRIGAIGVAFGTLIGAFVGIGVHFYVSMRLTSEFISIDRRRLIRDGMMRPLLCGSAGFLLIEGIESQVHLLVYQAVVVVLGTALVAAVLFRWNFSAHEREEISRLVLGRFRMFGVKVKAA
jgi:O-antigen/teichoic acid export membrane protein